MDGTHVMKDQIRKQWTAALRSGKYLQGRNNLALDGRFCCLGVLCALAVDENITDRSEPPIGSPVRFGGVSAFLPNEVSRWSGLDSFSPQVKYSALDPKHPAVRNVVALMGEIPDVVSLASLNDQGMPFSEIADLIDREFAEDDKSESNDRELVSA
jgi:hypothetical protein